MPTSKTTNDYRKNRPIAVGMLSHLRVRNTKSYDRILKANSSWIPT